MTEFPLIAAESHLIQKKVVVWAWRRITVIVLEVRTVVELKFRSNRTDSLTLLDADARVVMIKGRIASLTTTCEDLRERAG